MKTKRIYSIFSDGFCGYIYKENDQYFIKHSDDVIELIENLDSYLLSVIYRGYTIKSFEPNIEAYNDSNVIKH